MKCVWCLKREIKNPVWEQMVLGKDEYKPLCGVCARARLNNPYNALLPLRKINLTPHAQERLSPRG